MPNFNQAEKAKNANTQKFWTSGRTGENTRVLKGVISPESLLFTGISHKKNAPFGALKRIILEKKNDENQCKM